MRAHVRLYRGEGCHLCDAARAVIDGVRAQIPFELEVVAIDGDPELERRFRTRIPVVEVDGVEAFEYFVHPDGLRRRVVGS